MITRPQIMTLILTIYNELNLFHIKNVCMCILNTALFNRCKRLLDKDKKVR